jgi:Peptidase family M28
MDLPSKHVMFLSRRIGARGAESDGESAAASYVISQFEKADVDVDVETFFSCKSDLTAIIILYVLAIIAYLTFRVSYMLSFLIAASVFFLFQMETYSWAVISKLLHQSSASNVLGTVRSKGNAEQIVVLSANYDSAKSSPFGRPFLARTYRLLYIISFICIVMIIVLAIIGLGATLTKLSRHVTFQIWLFSSPFPVYLLIMAALMTWGEIKGLYTAGANDNASGVGVMLSVISAIAVNPLENTTVIGAATARSFAGGRGMIALLKKRKRTLKEAYIINLDHIGRGETRVITREGVMLGFHSSRRLTRLAMKVASSSKSLKIEKGKCRVKKSDAMVANARGYRAITIGGTSKGAYDGYRNVDDVFETIKRGSLDKAVRFVHLILEEIDKAATQTRGGGPAGKREPDDLEEEEEPSTDDIDNEVS